LPVLAEFAASNVLVAFDYDGTLAPIARTPAAARMRQRTRRLLASVARRYPCVVISGRPLDDLSRRLRRVPVWHLAGDHGSEATGQLGVQAAHVRDWAKTLRERLPVKKGLVIEQKRNSVTVHYRNVRDKRRVLEAVTDAIRHLHDARAVMGSEAINLLPFGGPHKGSALQNARRAFACDTAIYVGDDATDEDAFASAPPDRLLSICVGTRRVSAASYRLRNQVEIDGLLEALIECRSGRRKPARTKKVDRAVRGSRRPPAQER
jgi:trehalose 6-phosphate phosphatase